ncbi:MAG TPA: hypothetical protein VMD27_01780 [Candidatus Aquilonibacter sp.]|nr:hypothetical protein [Candidatus Aquilonibacter sp.]
MQAQPEKIKNRLPGIAPLLRGETETISAWSERWNSRRFALHVAVIILGAGLYGAAMGWWRDPRQALFAAAKFPLIILLTTLGNALINAMLAPLLGLNIPFRQSFSAIVMSFTITAAILGAFSPLMAFLIWNAPPMSPETIRGATYDFVKLANIAIIVFAGTTGNARLFQLLTRLAGSRTIALRVMFAWLAGNLFLGSQLSWILRPFIGSPFLPVEFLRANALHGNFYESVFNSLLHIFNH